jgi:Cytochrome P460
MKMRAKEIHVLALTLALTLSGCSGDEPKISAEFNQGASLVGNLPANPLQWRVISSSIDSAASQTSTLYGNDVAIGYARTNSQHEYPAGAVLALVTWAQAEDRRWFGAKIPAQVKSVEFVTVAEATPGQRSFSYQKFEGTPLRLSSLEQGAVPAGRVAYLLSQRAAVLP